MYSWKTSFRQVFCWVGQLFWSRHWWYEVTVDQNIVSNDWWWISMWNLGMYCVQFKVTTDWMKHQHSKLQAPTPTSTLTPHPSGWESCTACKDYRTERVEGFIGLIALATLQFFFLQMLMPCYWTVYEWCAQKYVQARCDKFCCDWLHEGNLLCRANWHIEWYSDIVLWMHFVYMWLTISCCKGVMKCDVVIPPTGTWNFSDGRQPVAVVGFGTHIHIYWD